MAPDLDDQVSTYTPFPETKDSLDDIFNTLRERLSELRTTVSEIQEMIDERKRLGHGICDEIEHELLRAMNFLREFEQPGAIRSGLERVRSVFEKEVFDLKSEKRRELVKEWEDIARLKKDLREYNERLKDAQRRLQEAEN
jgi:DNA repair exonuclease SbcCD ATPase subunit